MDFYLINKTRWKVPQKLLTWVMGEIQKRLEKKHKILKTSTVGVILVSEKAMTTLNSKFRQKHKVTDILSFSGAGEGELGELILCAHVVKRQAREHGLHPYEELSYLLLHGILHLLGYDHEPANGVSEKDAQKMMALQDRIFAALRKEHIPGVKNGRSQIRKKSSNRLSRY